MILFQHRVNHIEKLRVTPQEYGVEVDIRTWGDQLIIHHDAGRKGPAFESWIDQYRHAGLILNVKEEGLEERLIEIMDEREIDNYFFLDQSFPFLIKTVCSGESRCAVRVSEYESIETALVLGGKVDWVWVDCFTRFPLEHEDAMQLKDAGFKLCLVSPELQGRIETREIDDMRALLGERGITVDAVCTKNPERWK
ncbi:hypothetical protein [Magnetofaba australis]|uniref:GP-PDE domain-containing protein n=1 Tax=Magnetofaba australis IT-1 TaxID=1434232 RepID=A0A1Y2K5L0_9PROT|nr:hypothetical protein [Magnetofaba australis]OSM02285.1 hypothetical protein MAIT1_02405 [Magnetofaba australis IT-1]